MTYMLNSENMTLKGDKTPFLVYNKLEEIPFIRHAFSTRLGGVSTGVCESMNLAFGRGDSRETVLENYRLMCESAGFEFESLCSSVQIHEAKVKVVTAEDRGHGILRERKWTSADAIITNDKDVTLVTYYADCTPLFFIDTKNHAIGLAHGGWRGTVERIALNTIDEMKKNFGTNPEDLICAVGPVIGRCCYEIDSACAEHFKALSEIDYKLVLDEKPNGKFMADLALTNKLLLLHAGVKEENIVVSDLCTQCNSELLWSHRATKGQRGTMAAFMQILY